MDLSLLLTGRVEPYLVAVDNLQLEPESAAAFIRMQQAARLDGIELKPVSAYRNFDRQAAIWNGKMH